MFTNVEYGQNTTFIGSDIMGAREYGGLWRRDDERAIFVPFAQASPSIQVLILLQPLDSLWVLLRVTPRTKPIPGSYMALVFRIAKLSRIALPLTACGISVSMNRLIVAQNQSTSTYCERELKYKGSPTDVKITVSSGSVYDDDLGSVSAVHRALKSVRHDREHAPRQRSSGKSPPLLSGAENLLGTIDVPALREVVLIATNEGFYVPCLLSGILTALSKLIRHSHCSLSRLSLVNVTIDRDKLLSVLQLTPCLEQLFIRFRPWTPDNQPGMMFLVEAMADTVPGDGRVQHSVIPSLTSLGIVLEGIDHTNITFFDAKLVAMISSRYLSGGLRKLALRLHGDQWTCDRYF
ncbi:hypothetical protein IW261DRAFT_1425731 [Armillaria novae-zelandiae]|uniref:Uncharacterized protein n=1 Tax=Armillaria novae-zelandiae TaxID=153914 RepID=A0AA39U4V9_9AGAR|nr:hypothetical protein IW261DRAFT_1425731 [Armillaria novae-zelandiae]